jgi:hypothetical protein
MASTYLTRTPSSATNRKTWTFSSWFKTADGSGGRFLVASTDASNAVDYAWGNNGEIYLGIYESGAWKEVITNAKHRDVSAWYHLVIAVDTTQATASDRVKLYVNGNLQTSLATSNYPSINYDTAINNNVIHRIGAYTNNGLNFNGSMSHIHFIDGTAYDASAFGETDATTGEWKIKTSPSVTYGTNGFFILKDGNSVTDQSGNSNNWTVAGGTLTKTEDCPSNVYATWNPLATSTAYSGQNAPTNGNTTFVSGETGTNYPTYTSTLGFSSGKYYFECKMGSSGGPGAMIGISDQKQLSSFFGSGTYDYGYWGFNGNTYNNNSSSSYGNTFGNNDIIGCAVDLDNNKLYFHKNGTYQNSGVPTSGSTGTGAISISAASATTTGFYFFTAGDAGDGDAPTINANFGNGYFGTTAVASAGTNASGIGIFEYDVPTGYTALSTKGLNL